MRPVLFFSLAAALAATTTATAQENNDDKFVVSGSIQSDVIIPQEDTEIGAKKYNEWALTNTYADIAARSNHLDAGLRFEFTKHPLPGYADTDKSFKGWGVPNFYIKTHFDKFDLTLGTFYEQFGSGFIPAHTRREASVSTTRCSEASSCCALQRVFRSRLSQESSATTGSGTTHG